MPLFEGRNILIFSDGTGQAGGITFDEYRSNVYKLYRATRCGPDTEIDPDKQLAFYDPGFGSPLSGQGIRFGFLRKFYNLVSSATGLGITRNIIDCYAALICFYRPGDRIFLFGFSRGGLCVRCLGGVLGLCGIPTRMPGRQAAAARCEDRPSHRARGGKARVPPWQWDRRQRAGDERAQRGSGKARVPPWQRDRRQRSGDQRTQRGQGAQSGNG